MKKRTKIFISLISVLILTISVGAFSFASTVPADGTLAKTLYDKYIDADGNFAKIDVDGKTVFNSEDLIDIGNMIDTGKGKIANALNNTCVNKLTGSTALTNTSSFDEFEASINSLTVVPENLFFYDKTTANSAIVRYVKIGDEYFLCDEHGQLIDNNPQSVNTTNLVAYKGANKDSLTSGNSGYINGELVLGEAADAEMLITDLLNKTFTASFTVNGRTSTVKMAKGTTTYSPSVTGDIDTDGAGTSYDTKLQYASAPILTIKGANAFSCTWYLKAQNYVHATDEDGLGDFYRADGNSMDAGTVTVSYNNGTVTCSANTKPTQWAWAQNIGT